MTDNQAKSAHRVSLLPRDVREAIEAVVFDANAYGSALPDVASLAELARDLRQLDIATWVPEPVAWEWAEHVARAWTTGEAAARRAQTALRRAGLGMVFDPVYADRTAVIERCLASLSDTAHLLVVPLTGESAIAGLKDQVLQRPPAKTKGDPPVKTGGSDSSWLREVLARVGDDGGKLLFVSQDKDIDAAFREWGHMPPRRCRLGDVRGLLFPTEAAMDQDVVLVARYLVERLPQSLVNPPTESGGPLIDADSATLREAVDVPGPYDEGITRLYLDRLTRLAGIDHILVLRPEGDEQPDPNQTSAPTAASRTVTARVFLLADVDAARTVHDVDTGEVATSVDTVATDVLVIAPMVFELDNGAVVSARQDGDVRVAVPARFDEPEDALPELIDALSAVPGLEEIGETDWQAIAYAGDEQDKSYTAPSGQIITVSTDSGERGAGLRVRVGDHEASVACEYDATTWIGGSEGMYMEPPYWLSFGDASDRWSGAGAWMLSAWTIAQCVGQHDGEEQDSAPEPDRDPGF